MPEERPQTSNERNRRYQSMITQLGDIFASKIRSEPHPQPQAGSEELSLFRDLAKVTDRYEYVRFVGQGGMKRITAVIDNMTDREVAMAELFHLDRPELIEQFILEARITARLEHPNIMPIYDIGISSNNTPFFTMKLIRGQNLAEIIFGIAEGDPNFRKKYDLNTLMDIFIKICDAVAYAHANGVLHLDLKPANIQVGDFGEVLVCDWGLSRYREGIHYDQQKLRAYQSSKLTVFNDQIKGSPGYMSPEQFLYSRPELTKASDIYALGIILYEILTHRLPFDSLADLEKVMQATIEGDITSPSLRAPELTIPPSLEAVCMTALHLDPRCRYSDVLALKDEILKFRQGFATTAERASWWTSLILLARRHYAATAVTMVSAVLLTGIGLSFIIYFRLSEMESTRLLAAQKLEEQRRLHAEQAAASLSSQATKSAYLSFNLKELFASFSQAIELNPNDSNLLLIKGFMFLGNQDFSQALEALSASGLPQVQPYVERCRRYSANARRLSRQEFLELATQLQADGFEPAVQHLAISEAAQYPQLQDRIVLTYQLLKCLNPRAGEADISLKSEEINDELQVSLSNQRLISNITPLVILPITHLNLSGTRVANISPLQSLPLSALDLSQTLVSDLSPILNISTLKTLSIAKSRVASLSPLKQSSIISLDISDNELDDLSPLEQLPNLAELTISDTPYNRQSLNQMKLSPNVRIYWR